MWLYNHGLRAILNLVSREQNHWSETDRRSGSGHQWFCDPVQGDRFRASAHRRSLRSGATLRTMFEKVTNVVLILVCGYVAFTLHRVYSQKGTQPPPLRHVEWAENPGWRERGPAAARKVAVLVSDYECPFCSRILDSEFYTALSRGVDAGKIRLAVSDFPLPMHSNALRAAQAARCAAEQGRFWEADGELHRHYNNLDSSLLAGYVKSADPGAFAACLASGRHTAAIRAEAAFWTRLEVNSTPTVILGRYLANGRFHGSLFQVAPSVADTQRWIDYVDKEDSQ